MKTYKYKYHCNNDIGFKSLTGLIIESIIGLKKGSEVVIFTTECGKQFKMYHEQDCCETVDIDDVCGDVGDLIGSLVFHAEERSNEIEGGVNDDSATFTFYDIQTSKGSVNIKWLGESNGYYSESVTFCEGEID